MIKRLLFTLALAGLAAAPAAADGKYGYLGAAFMTMEDTQRMVYVAGVLDTLDSVGVRCPVPPTYRQIIDETLIVLYRNPELRQQWAAKSVGAAMYNRGCTTPTGQQ